jgi:hypothetical protein
MYAAFERDGGSSCQQQTMYRLAEIGAQKFKKPIVVFTIRAVKRCFLIRFIPNSVGLKDLYFQACVFGLVRDLLKTKPKDRPNSS